MARMDDFNAELEDGRVQTKVRDRRTESGGQSTSTTPAAAPVPTVRTFQSTGGSVTVSQNGNSLTLVAAVPASGFAADVRKSSGDSVEVRFSSGKRESRVEVKLENGVAQERVENR